MAAGWAWSRALRRPFCRRRVEPRRLREIARERRRSRPRNLDLSPSALYPVSVPCARRWVPLEPPTPRLPPPAVQVGAPIRSGPGGGDHGHAGHRPGPFPCSPTPSSTGRLRPSLGDRPALRPRARPTTAHLPPAHWLWGLHLPRPHRRISPRRRIAHRRPHQRSLVAHDRQAFGIDRPGQGPQRLLDGKAGDRSGTGNPHELAALDTALATRRDPTSATTRRRTAATRWHPSSAAARWHPSSTAARRDPSAAGVR